MDASESSELSAVVAAHRAARERGEERVLRRTRGGGLHSYAPDEIGLGPVVSGTQATSWWGLSIVAAVLWACFAVSWLIVLGPTSEGRSPAWGGLAVTVLAGGLGGYASLLARRQYRARAVRRRRGVPEPSDVPVPDRWADPAPPRPLPARAGHWRLRPWWWVVPRGLVAAVLVLAVVGTTTEPGPGSPGVLAFALTGLVLSVVVPVVLAVRRVALSSRTGSRASRRRSPRSR